MEAAIRWFPHSYNDHQRFLLVDAADASLALHEVRSLNRHRLTSDVVATASKLPNFGAFDLSKQNEGIVALGLVSGNVNLLRLHEDGRSAETVSSYRTKQQRKCNSVAFSNENWLAVALDKTRSDVCLNIYDVGNAASQDPVRRLCAAELVSSVRFFPSRPQEIVAAAQRSFIRTYDLRDGFSTRPSLQAATRNVNNIAIDPTDDHYFASGGSTDDPSVTVWDKRWLAGQSSAVSTASGSGSATGAVFDFRPAVNNATKTTVWSLRYSGQRRGRLGICSSTGEVKVIDMTESRSSLSQDSLEYAPSNPFGGSSWTCNRYVSQTRTIERPWHDPTHQKDPKRRIVAFDWVQNDSSEGDQLILALRPGRSVDVLRVPFSKSHASITGRSDFALTTHEELHITEPKMQGNGVGTPSRRYQRSSSIAAEDFGPSEYHGDAESMEEDASQPLKLKANSPKLASLLASTTKQRERCRQGYLFNCLKNMEIVAGNWYLERLWEIVNRFEQQAADDGMVCDGLDLSYVGVTGLWSEKIGTSPRRMRSAKHVHVYDAISGLNQAKSIPAFEGERTGFPEHRQLGLMICGWKFTPDALEEECQELIDRGLYYQAIVQAVLHDDKHMALNFLRTLIRSKTIPNTGLNALLAADSLNDEQREMCQWMAADTDDSALKALLTFLITGNWRDVMKLNYLHLGYRVALGLRYLNDTELSGFLQSETARAVKNGDLEGILLTGLSEQSMNLLQTYITKTNDLQTAVLASAFTNPLYVNDVRWEMWKETYLLQMQAWRAFTQRAKLTVQHNRMAKTKDGLSLVTPPQKQLQLRCMHCNGSIAQNRSSFSGPKNRNAETNSKPPQLPSASAGTICLTCGRHLPRCGICLRWLGTPDPSKPGGALELDKGADPMAKFLTFCVDCGHGFHADHAQKWFQKHSVCPVPDCECVCGHNV